MADGGLTAYWITSADRHAPLGFGVTALSLDDALALIRAFDFGRFLPDDLAGVHVAAGVSVGDLDPAHVVPNMGPMAVRGMWYPLVALGVPRWAEERLASGRG
jgi:hypothetical protein